MSEIVLKRKAAEAMQRIVKSSAPDVEGLGLLCGALGDLLGAWTGQRVRVLICADDQSEAIDMTKAPPASAEPVAEWQVSEGMGRWRTISPLPGETLEWRVDYYRSMPNHMVRPIYAAPQQARHAAAELVIAYAAPAIVGAVAWRTDGGSYTEDGESAQQRNKLYGAGYRPLVWGDVAAAQPSAEPPTLADVLDALSVFNPPRAEGGEPEPWTADQFMAVSALPAFIHNVGRAWYRAAPQASPATPPARQPLTDEQIAKIVHEAAGALRTRRNGTTTYRIARGIEAAHGITAEPADPAGSTP